MSELSIGLFLIGITIFVISHVVHIVVKYENGKNAIRKEELKRISAQAFLRKEKEYVLELIEKWNLLPDEAKKQLFSCENFIAGSIGNNICSSDVGEFLNKHS